MEKPVKLDPPTSRCIAAPMVDQSELAFRMLCREYGAGLCYTPMFHAANFVKDKRYRQDNFSTCDQDRPLIVQFCANDPKVFAEAAKLVEDQCDAVDLNLGCPQGIARKGHYGAFLQDEWDLLTDMISTASQACKVPISCKIRIFADVNKTVEYAERLKKAGAKLITVHGRTREMKGQQTGLADWTQVKAVKQHLTDTPIFSNGNIQFSVDVEKCLEMTGADGVMSAEGLLFNPALFSGLHIPVWILCKKYMNYFQEHGETNISHLKAHLFKMLHHVIQDPENEGLREDLTNARVLQDFSLIIERIREKYEIAGEEQSLPMTTLPVPIYVSQPYFRNDRIFAQQIKNREQPCDKKVLSQSQEEEQKSKRQKRKELKKSRREAKKEARVQLQLCLDCKNPRGVSCSLSLCKICCQIREETCEYHTIGVKRRKVGPKCSLDVT